MPKTSVEKFALSVTRWIGSPASIILHTILFILSFAVAVVGWIEWDKMLLVLTTIVSLEAIYLAIFIQMTINYTTEDIEEIQENIDEIQEDVGEMQEDIEEVQEDIEEVQEDVEDISEDVEEMTEEEKKEEAQEKARESEQQKMLTTIQADLQRLLVDIDRLKNNQK